MPKVQFASATVIYARVNLLRCENFYSGLSNANTHQSNFLLYSRMRFLANSNFSLIKNCMSKVYERIRLRF